MKINFKLPLLIIPKMGTLKLGGKTFTYDDICKGIIPITQFIKEPNWYGGRVKSFGKTKENFLLCIEGKRVIGIYFPNVDYLSEITLAGLQLMEKEGIVEELIDDSNVPHEAINIKRSEIIPEKEPEPEKSETVIKKRGRPKGGETNEEEE